ncbi:MAG: phosphofructokinase, partial [Micromonosporaceae bacterium]|nr:phosphofructokinase [Micromonosporaceae bacterium]
MVFAPSPQLTVTIEQLGEEPDVHLHPGGQGVWQARMITSLGVSVTLCAALGGEIGRVLRPLIEAEGIDLQVVGGNAGNGVYVHDRRQGKRVVLAESPGDPVPRHVMDELYGLALTHGLHADLSLLSGPASERVVDTDTYRRLASDLSGNGVRVIADLSGAYLDCVLEGGVSFLKISDEELIRDGRARDDSEAELIRAVRELRAQGAATIVASRADRPALALLHDDLVEVVLPKLEPADSRGAGDSMTAGAAAVLASGGDLATAIRTGAAAGALNVTRRGLGTGRVDLIERLMERVELRPVRQDPEHGGTGAGGGIHG